jgi:DNA excision repair protein ERCC-6
MQVLAHLLRQCHRNSSRVLLFSNSTRILDLIQTLVVSQGFEYRRLDGSSSLKQRAFTVKEFQQGHVFALLMTTKVGGVGLNLTAADVVILFDPNWNPAHDCTSNSSIACSNHGK